MKVPILAWSETHLKHNYRLPIPSHAISKHWIIIWIRFSQTKEISRKRLTFAGGDEIVLIIVDDGRKAEVSDGTRVTVTCQRHDLGRFWSTDQQSTYVRGAYPTRRHCRRRGERSRKVVSAVNGREFAELSTRADRAGKMMQWANQAEKQCVARQRRN